MASVTERTVEAAEAVLARTRSVSPLDVLTAMRWVTANHVDHWRRGRSDHLEPLLQLRAENLAAALKMLREWAQAKGLEPAEIDYLSANRDRRQLTFLPDGAEELERMLRTHWVPADRREQVIAKESKPPDLVVIEPLKPFTCAACGGTGELLVMEDAGSLCLTCADLDTLEFLPAGDATLTRRAKKASTLSAVVVRWNRSRKRYQRLGILVQEAGLREAEASCLADADVRSRQRERDAVRRAAADVDLMARMAVEIGKLFPGCPPERAQAIAEHTAVRGSGRVGRSAAGRELEANAITAAVVASVRHEDTPYDALLMSGVARDDARERIRADVDAVLSAWRTG